MIKTNVIRKDGEPLLQIEIDGKGGNAVANLAPQSALSLRNRINSLLVDLINDALDENESIDEVFG